jgi:hypothetical protein
MIMSRSGMLLLTAVLTLSCGDGPPFAATSRSIYYDDLTIVCHTPPDRPSATHRLVVGGDVLAAHLAHGDAVLHDPVELCPGMALTERRVLSIGGGLPSLPGFPWVEYPVRMNLTLLGNVTSSDVAVLLLPDGVWHLNPWVWRLLYVDLGGFITGGGWARGWPGMPDDFEQYLTFADLLVAHTENVVFAWADFTDHPESVDFCIEEPTWFCAGDPEPFTDMLFERVLVFTHSGAWDGRPRSAAYVERVPGMDRPPAWIELFETLRGETLAALEARGVEVTHLALAGTSQSGDFTLRAARYDTRFENGEPVAGSVPCFFAGSPEGGPARPDEPFSIHLEALEALHAARGIGGRTWIDYGVEEGLLVDFFDGPHGRSLAERDRVVVTPIDHPACDDFPVGDCGHANIDEIYLRAAALVTTDACRR